MSIKKEIFRRIKKPKDLSELKIGMIHCRFGDAEGVSIVMEQVERVLNKELKVPKENIFYLIGKSKIKSKRITEEKLIFDYDKTNRLMQELYERGYDDKLKKEIEAKVEKAKDSIRKWVKNNKLDILIVHNSAHPVNFISSLAINRYYREAEQKKEKTPKYIMWWHDSHLERKSFLHPAKDVSEYILEGVPGEFVEYIIFINSLQFKIAERFFRRLDRIYPGFYRKIKANHSVGFNTSDIFISGLEDLKSEKIRELKERFIKDFKIEELLQKNNLQLKDTLFVLQPTRVVDRKRIDFALRYCYELLNELKKKGDYKAIYFLVSGHSVDETKNKIINLNKELQEKYKTKNLFLNFAEDNKTDLKFLEYPRIFARLEGIATYFSEVEGFGNNLLEVLASGLIPVIYTYPVYNKDIAQFKFKLIKLKEFKLNKKKIKESAELIRNKKKKKSWIKKNIKIMAKHFAHSIMAPKIRRAILSKRPMMINLLKQRFNIAKHRNI